MKISMIINAVLAIALVFLSYKLAVTGNDSKFAARNLNRV